MPRSDENIRAWLDRLEREARERPRRHALRLAVLAVLGYCYPLALVLVSFGLAVALLSLAPSAFSVGIEVTVFYFIAVIVALALLAAVVGTLWVKLPPPMGHALRPGEATPLRVMADEVSRAAGAPLIHEFHVSAELNAGVYSHPRFGFWGRRTNYFTAGLPLLAAQTPEQFRAVLAHEVGHLKGAHSDFGAWIYRIHRTWAALAEPFQAAGWVRWVVIGWFVRWYGEYFALATLAVRRRQEYEADRRIAELVGARAAADSLASLSWADFRLSKEFWPALRRLAGHDPLPPADVITRIARLMTEEPPAPDLIERWRQEEQRNRTPITSDHPCLVDRLAALGCSDVLRAGLPNVPVSAAASSLPLLGDALDRAVGVASALWKASSIAFWRSEHGYARYLAERAAERAKKPGDPNDPAQVAEAAWEDEQPRVHYGSPAEALDALHEFLRRFPDHGKAAFTLGQMLLNRGDEDQAVEWLEHAIRHDSDAITPVLSILLEHYRSAGRDQEADVIRERLLEHERALGRSRRERLSVRRGDRFLPHGLPADELEKVKRVLRRFPQVRAARLVRKQVRLFTDKPSYVLAVDRRRSALIEEGNPRRRLIDGLREQMPIPCAVVVPRWTSFGLRRRLRDACPEPVFQD